MRGSLKIFCGALSCNSWSPLGSDRELNQELIKGATCNRTLSSSTVIPNQGSCTCTQGWDSERAWVHLTGLWRQNVWERTHFMFFVLTPLTYVSCFCYLSCKYQWWNIVHLQVMSFTITLYFITFISQIFLNATKRYSMYVYSYITGKYLYINII